MPSPDDRDARLTATLAAFADVDDAPLPLPVGRRLAGGVLDLGDAAPPTRRALLDALREAPALPGLRGLLLDDGDLRGRADGERVAACLSRQVSIRRLDLSGAALGDVGLRAVLDALGPRPCALDLDGAEATTPALRIALAEGLAAGRLGVEHLSLRAAPQAEAMTEVELAAWLAALARGPLRSLDLRGRAPPPGAGARLLDALAANDRVLLVALDLGADDPAVAALRARLAHANNRAPRSAARPPSRARLRAAASDPRASTPPLRALPAELDVADLEAFLRVADTLARRPDRLLDADDPRLIAVRERLLSLQRQLRREVRREVRTTRRATREAAREAARERDREALARVGIRRGRGANRAPPPVADDPDPNDRHTLHGAQRCYVCKAPYRELHPFYDRLCPACGERSYARRGAAVDLRGR
ncbi:MAG: hypothetical protein R3A79_26965, partial [Nannocystaceae bacterium]